MGELPKMYQPNPNTRWIASPIADALFQGFRCFEKTLDALKIRDLLVDGLLLLAPVDVDALVLHSIAQNEGGWDEKLAKTRQQQLQLSVARPACTKHLRKTACIHRIVKINRRSYSTVLRPLRMCRAHGARRKHAALQMGKNKTVRTIMLHTVPA